MWKTVDLSSSQEIDQLFDLYEEALDITDRVNELALMQQHSNYRFHGFWSTVHSKFIGLAITYYLTETQIFHIDLMYLQPKFRKQGIGAIMVDRLVHHLFASFPNQHFKFVSFEACPFIHHYATRVWSFDSLDFMYSPMFTRRSQTWMLRHIDACERAPHVLKMASLIEWLKFQQTWKAIKIKPYERPNYWSFHPLSKL